MSWPAIVSVVLGLVLTYSLLSMICTTLNEMIAATLQLRAKALHKTLGALVDDRGLRDAFFSHGLIGSAGASSGAGKEGRLPSYLDGQNVAMALLQSLEPDTPLPAVQQIETAVANLPDSRVKDVIASSLQSAAGDMDKLRTGIADWFDSAMDRLSGEYSRRMKWLSFGIGIGLAILLNVDSLYLATSIWSDPNLQAQVDSTTFASTAGGMTDGGSSCSTVADGRIACLADQLVGYSRELRPLPIGWSLNALPHGQEGGSGWAWIWWSIAKLAGLLWTGIALSLGAPFWFDVLQRVTNLRAAGGKPEPATK